MDLPLLRAMKLIEIAEEEEIKDKIYQFYVQHTPVKKGTEQFVPFDEYYEKNKPQRIVTDITPKEDLIRKSLDIQKKAR
jgi:glucan biosynthesis protein